MHTTTDKRGYDLFVEVLAHVETHPETYNQAVWGSAAETDPTVTACQTSHCIAGWAVNLAGLEVSWEKEQQHWYMGAVTVPEIGPMSVAGAANEVLGVNGYDIVASASEEVETTLYAGSNDLDDVYAAGAQLYRRSEEDVRLDVKQRVAQIEATPTKPL